MNNSFTATAATTTRRQVQCSCGSRHAERGYTDDGAAWRCANCYAVTPRQVRTSARQRRMNNLVAQLVAAANSEKE